MVSADALKIGADNDSTLCSAVGAASGAPQQRTGRSLGLLTNAAEFDYFCGEAVRRGSLELGHEKACLGHYQSAWCALRETGSRSELSRGVCAE